MKVKDEPDLVRDPHTGAVQNTNNDAYKAYISRRNAIIDNQTRLDKLEVDSEAIKTTLSLILQLLQEKQ